MQGALQVGNTSRKTGSQCGNGGHLEVHLCALPVPIPFLTFFERAIRTEVFISTKQARGPPPPAPPPVIALHLRVRALRAIAHRLSFKTLTIS